MQVIHKLYILIVTTVETHTIRGRNNMAELAKFPKKGKSNKVKEKKLTTHDRRMKSIKLLNGKYNGWWIYQYAMNEFSLMRKKNRR
jgi:hypothetical protein|tara:strand:+ start:358 stop:615 length:258 start_codon:yes stop_codon:yes gene_type:complete